MKEYTITHGTVLHQDTIYQVGDAITLDDATAKQLAIHLDKPASTRQPEPEPEASDV